MLFMSYNTQASEVEKVIIGSLMIDETYGNSIYIRLENNTGQERITACASDADSYWHYIYDTSELKDKKSAIQINTMISFLFEAKTKRSHVKIIGADECSNTNVELLRGIVLM